MSILESDVKATCQVDGREDIQANASEMGGQTETLCGFGPFKPAFLQPFKRIGVVTGMFGLSASLTMTLSVYIGSQITAIEKNFGFSSSQSGLLLSCNEIGFLLSTMVAGYAARHVHIPRVLCASMCLYGFGGWVCSLAYFTSHDIFKSKMEALDATGNISHTTSIQSKMPLHLCGMNNRTPSNATEMTDGNNTFEIGLPNKYSTIATVLIGIGMAMQGVCKSVRSPFMVTYIDDNGDKRNTAMYTGFLFAATGFGPALAFGIGAMTSRIYVTLEDVAISPRHPSWIGAWWLGFVVIGSLSIAAALPLVCFPRRIKPAEVTNKNKESNTRSISDRTVCKTVSGFWRTLWRLFTNRVYCLMLISKALVLFCVAGIAAYGAKYIETQFFVPAWKANISVGLTTMLPICLGTSLSGLWLSKRRLTPLQCIKFLIVTAVVSSVTFVPIYFIGCDTPVIVGLNSDIHRRSLSDRNASCRGSYNFDQDQYLPICASDNRNYFSPCVAGCGSEFKQASEASASSQMFLDCECVGHNATAVPGLCTADCQGVVPFLLFLTITSIVTSTQVIPFLIVSIRSVNDADKSMAIGLDSFVSGIFGWLFSPLVFGPIIDTTCLLWTTSGDLKGACALYDNDLFRTAITCFVMVPKTLQCILLLLSYCVARSKSDWSVDTVRHDDSLQDPQSADPLVTKANTEV